MLAFYLSLIENHDNDDDFVRIFNKYKNSMYNVAFSYLKDYHHTQDALQIAFTGIAKNMGTIKSLTEEKLEIYVLKSAKNAAISILEDKNSISNNTFSMEEQYNEVPSNDDIIENTITKELLEEIFNFINTMDEKYRDILSLYFLHELNFREIAIALNIPVSTIKDRFRKGHKLVIEKFKEFRK